jgi:hypothetical protein
MVRTRREGGSLLHVDGDSLFVVFDIGDFTRSHTVVTFMPASPGGFTGYASTSRRSLHTTMTTSGSVVAAHPVSMSPSAMAPLSSGFVLGGGYTGSPILDAGRPSEITLPSNFQTVDVVYLHKPLLCGSRDKWICATPAMWILVLCFVEQRERAALFH